MLPALIRRPAELVATNTASALIDGASTVVGPLLAGLGLALVGGSPALWASSALLIATAALVSPLSSIDVMTETRAPGTHPPVFDAFARLVRTGPIRVVVGLSGAQTAVRGALHVLVVLPRGRDHRGRR